MRITHVNTAVSGGAARAAQRVHAALVASGVESKVFVQRKGPYEPNTRVYEPVEKVIAVARRNAIRRTLRHAIDVYRNTRPAGHEMFADDRTDIGHLPLAQVPACDVLHLHWVSGFIDYRKFVAPAARRWPLVWTLHDMNPFTGGCHYAETCMRFAESCGACPQLGSIREDDLSRAIWQRKQQVFDRIPADRLNVVSISRWMAEEVARSSLLKRFPVHVVPLGLDTAAFAPRDRAACRAVLNIPQDASVVLFAADSVTNRRKGFSLLAEALAGIDDIPGLLLVSVGMTGTSLPVRARQLHLGTVSDDRLLTMVYSAADVFVIPSLYEAFGQTAMEAAACGTPSIGFDVGGIPDVVVNDQTGLLVPRGDVAGLRRSIHRILTDTPLRVRLAAEARRRVELNHNLSTLAAAYRRVYESAMSHGAR